MVMSWCRWQNLPSAGDYISMELSSVACDLLVSLRQQLQFLEANVCQAACKKIWPIILDGLDSLVMSEVNYKPLHVLQYAVYLSAGDPNVSF